MDIRDDDGNRKKDGVTKIAAFQKIYIKRLDMLSI